MDPANYYDDSYFQWQGALGTFTGEMEAEKFLHYIRDDHMVMDFGCGGGFLLNAIKCQRKLGVEVNPAARRSASKLGIDTIASITDAPDATFDVVISNHALEHVPSPIDITKSVLAKLKPGGIAVFVVPCERYDTAYAPQNVDRHLYTWSPMNLGNLFQASGFNVREVKRLAHRWPPFVRQIDRLFGRAVCNVICNLHGFMRPKLTQIRIVAQRPLTDGSSPTATSQ